jgi:zinc protease
VLNVRGVTAGAATGEEVLRETLDNGFRVVAAPSAPAPVVTTEINYLVGSNKAPPLSRAWLMPRNT